MVISLPNIMQKQENCILKVCLSSVTFAFLPTLHHASEFAKGLIIGVAWNVSVQNTNNNSSTF